MLKTLRERDDVRGVLGVLETCIRNNFAGVESARYDSIYAASLGDRAYGRRLE